MSAYQRPATRPPSSRPALLGGLVLGFLLGAATVAGGTYAAGYRLVDRDTAKVVEELRAWAKDPETDRKMRAAGEKLKATAEQMKKLGDSFKDVKIPTIPEP